jgi:hypothetical protein
VAAWNTTLHASTTVKMGRICDLEACVDKDCRVFYVKGLRVADMSVVPIVPKYVNVVHQLSMKLIKTSNQRQPTAYYIGATGGDKIIAEYGLDFA